MNTQLALRVHEDVAVRHERLLLHAEACRQSAVRLAGCVFVCVCLCLCVGVCLCMWERQRERKRERASESERERESEREKERESVCVHLCMHKVRRGAQVKGTKRMKTQLALRVHEDVAVRHERLLLHANACRQASDTRWCRPWRFTNLTTKPVLGADFLCRGYLPAPVTMP